LLGADGLAERARVIAQLQKIKTTGQIDRRGRLLTRLDDSRLVLIDARERLSAASARGSDIGPAGDWLLDNHHVVEEHIREVRDSLPRGYYAELPELVSGTLAGYPRVYEIATTLISHTEGRIDQENVANFVRAFQEITPLAIGELWAIPAMLRLALIESVRRMALRTLARLDDVEAADAWAHRLATDDSGEHGTLPDALDDFLANHPPLTPAFVARFLPQLRQADNPLTANAWIAPWMADEGVSAEDVAARAHERLALTQLMTANSITSLRAIGRLDWKLFVESQSVMEAVLRDDPAGVYARMTFTTRDAYRHVVERIARRTKRSEQEVAARAIRLALDGAKDAPQDAARGHVGYYLVDEGRAQLEADTQYRPGFGESWHRLLRRHPNVVLFGGITTFTLAALTALVVVAHWRLAQPWSVGVLLLIALFALVPANDVGVRLLNELVTLLLPPRTLPKLDLSGAEGIPPEFRTVVVIPTLFADVDDVQEALDNLEVQFLANREAHLHFAVLSDFTDAAEETRPGDDAIVTAAVEGVRALNARYASDRHDEFYLFHRARKWNPNEQRWMGWERKRGKLGEFNRMLRSGSTSAFAVVEGDLAVLREVRYAITLDADTVLPPDAAPLLVGAIAHPLNRAVYDASRGRVVRGYGILQPRVGVSLPSAHRSRFAAIHSGHPGVDPYTTAVSDVYQDLYDEGSFTGKGIYDVDAFEMATHGRFPENTLLSHDLIEGSYARAGLATDIEVFDDYPMRYASHVRRKHRWIRGDWQLLRWLGRTVPGPDGPERNRLSWLSRWRLIDNLRRSLVEPAQFLLFVAGWTILPGSPLRWTAIAIVAVAAPWLVSLALAACRPPLDRSWRAYYSALGNDALTSAKQIALAITVLPHQAWLSVDAIARTLWRMSVSHRHLLEWQSASHAERMAHGTVGDSVRAMAPALLLSLVALALVVLRTLSPNGLPGMPGIAPSWSLVLAVLPLVALWCASPLVTHAVSAPAVPRRRRLPGAQRLEILRYAAAHWQFFEQFVTADTHWLAPDNVQEDPSRVVAMRTSPTNIGLQLLSIVSAHDLGFITLDEMLVRLERVFASLAQMRRFRGHFYNWYDLHDLRVLEPSYVSTVDSGNLAGHLIALRQACLSLAAVPGNLALAARLDSIAVHAETLAAEMDFHVLFEPDRELFSIGYQDGTHQLDPSSYDLLASEARLASFLAVARDQVPVDHWFRLGRTLTHASGATALVSWSGSMFEYLMPSLVMRSFPLTLLDQTCQGAVRRHIAYARARGVPWGISESAYNMRDRHLTYQYRAFGVPDLALKRGLARDLVIAPYASALAMMIAPTAALTNLADLEQRGALGACGFHDALDFTRTEPGAGWSVVQNYMAHHIGMSLVAFTNVLTGDTWPRRFHADPLVRAAELLLHERIPRRLHLQRAQRDDTEQAKSATTTDRPSVRDYDTPDTQQPRVALLGHLPYTVMVTNGGGGSSRFEQFAVNRWRADATTDDAGQFCYVKDLASGRVWSTTHQPTGIAADAYRARFAIDRVTFHRVDGDIETRTEIAVVPADAGEVRRTTLTNNGTTARVLELTSYAEVVMAPREADRAHPAFGNLFVETEWHAWCHAVFATRRPRASSEQPVWLAHIVAIEGTRVGDISCETDRARFLGRGRSVRLPAALDRAADGPLSDTVGPVLDPVMALRVRVHLAPGASATVAFTTLVATTRDRAFELADRYDDPRAAQRALDLAWTTAHAELREMGITPADAALFQDLAGHLLYPEPELGASADDRTRNRGSQPLLWTAGISGDAPTLLATIDSVDGLPTLRQLLAAHQYWRRRGLKVDLVVLDTHRPTYLRDAHDSLLSAVLASSEAAMLDQPGGVFIRRADLLAADTLLMLRTTARLHVACDGRAVLNAALPGVPASDPDLRDPARLIGRRAERSTPPVLRAIRTISRVLDQVPALVSGVADRLLDEEVQELPWPVAAPAAPEDNGHDTAATVPPRAGNGIGALTPSNDYEIALHGTTLPPAPWSNVIANALGGFIVSERGAGSAWAGSSYFYRLTPWHNDPVTDPISDVLYLRDDETGALWSATPAPIRHADSYTVVHAAGTSTFAHTHDDIATTLTLGIAPDDAVKLSSLEITNHSTRARRITLTAYAEWTLGVTREESRQHVRTAYDATRRAITAVNRFDQSFASYTAFCAITEPVAAYTAGRRGFLGRNGSVAAPAALVPGATLAAATGVGLDPCAALQCALVLAPGETRRVAVLLGAGTSDVDAQRLMTLFGNADAARAAIDETSRRWAQRLSVVEVRTPEPSFDAMVNRWSLYQALACRMWARSALYQSSGAYGFRDQLQDVMAFVYAEPALAREHLLRVAARQFVEGDVQHWWHSHSGRGVRTRFSDDMAWLPFVVEHYVRVTGDRTVLDEVVPFLTMSPLAPGEHERYDLPQISAEEATLYEHCVRAWTRAATRGEHGLPLIGAGDWNDGMSRVGVDGRGESVWLAWFLVRTARLFAPLADARGEQAFAATLLADADGYVQAVEQHAWDGEWYRRAFFDDGTPMGSRESDECRIDAIAQSWSVISGAGNADRQRLAMDAFERQLVNARDRLLMLLTPPFDRTTHDPGYIKGYVPGVRENGAQYTHAALWSVMATAQLGRGDRAFELFQMLNPLTHSDTPEEMRTYKVEPYAIAADVYTATGHMGRGGWTWYTGSASWFYRVALETLLGFTRVGDTLVITPCVPSTWPSYSIGYRFGDARYDITVELVASAGDVAVMMDGQPLDKGIIPLRDDGRMHQVIVRTTATPPVDTFANATHFEYRSHERAGEGD
jgi:cyclic beta-1,2-glucan synthetase